jgi:xanthine/uracil permease
MKERNVKALENLNLCCQVCGVVVLFMGIMIILLDLLNREFTHLMIGLFMVAIGYALTKISSKISAIILDENLNYH